MLDEWRSTNTATRRIVSAIKIVLQLPLLFCSAVRQEKIERRREKHERERERERKQALKIFHHFSAQRLCDLRRNKGTDGFRWNCAIIPWFTQKCRDTEQLHNWCRSEEKNHINWLLWLCAIHCLYQLTYYCDYYNDFHFFLSKKMSNKEIVTCLPRASLLSLNLNFADFMIIMIAI